MITYLVFMIIAVIQIIINYPGMWFTILLAVAFTLDVIAWVNCATLPPEHDRGIHWH